MHIVFILLAAVLGVLLPDAAWAGGVLTPSHGNTWDLYVFGNGRIIFDILTSIKMLMVPDSGSSGFQMLLLLMASLGFLVLAVAAGFDPGKNLMRMFTYILVVWGVSWGSTSLTANLNINDLVVNQDGLKETYTIDRVPALVALPAALTSQVGYYFSRVIETYFTIPDGFKVASGNGQFNLFSKMVQESNEFIFTDAGTKNTMMAYVTDCVVPAIARGAFSDKVKDPLSGEIVTKYGGDVLAQSPNLLQALASARHNSIMTKVFDSALAPAGDAASAAAADPSQRGFGQIMTCAAAYDRLSTMMNANAAALVNASSTAYAKSGILTPYETLFSSMLAGAAAPGGAGSTYSRPSGYILQQGMLNSMSGAFRQAALQTGNNELMTAASISQAEQSQRSTWVAGFHTFNNMMGYVFTVLQAFIFAITPMVVVALMVPGLGKSIFTNYAQILIWLTLWMPMLALINYIITLFGTDTITSTMGMSGGLSMSNKGLLSERTNNLVIAAQFLGTSTPLLTWGLVKGAMAFTEFISHGVGNAFASQAGATAASGNMSLNNMSMDNTSMNKFNTAMSSTVGTQATNAFTNSGALMTSQDMAGGGAAKSGSPVDFKKSMGETLSKGMQESQAISNVLSAATSNATSVEDAYQKAKSSGHSQANEQAAQRIYNNAVAWQKQHGSGENAGTAEAKAMADSIAKMDSIKKGQNASVDAAASVGGDLGIVSGKLTTKIGASRSADTTANDGTTASRQTGTNSGRSNSDQVGGSQAAGTTSAATVGARNGTSRDATEQAAHRVSASQSSVLSDAKSSQDSVTRSYSAAQSVASSFGTANDMDSQIMAQGLAKLQSLEGNLGAATADIENKLVAGTAAFGGSADAIREEIAHNRGTIGAHAAQLGPSGNAVAGDVAAIRAESKAGMANMEAEEKVKRSEVEQKVTRTNTEVDKRQKAGALGDSNLLTTMPTGNGSAPVPTTSKMNPGAIPRHPRSR